LKKNVLKVRNEALVRDGSETFVYVPPRPDEPDQKQRVKVQIGKTDGARTEIVSGLKPDSQVWIDRATVRPAVIRSKPTAVAANAVPAAPPPAVATPPTPVVASNGPEDATGRSAAAGQ
jgi:hypothetical protein